MLSRRQYFSSFVGSIFHVRYQNCHNFYCFSSLLFDENNLKKHRLSKCGYEINVSSSVLNLILYPGHSKCTEFYFKVPRIKILKMKEAIPSHNYPTSDCVVRKALYCKIGNFKKKFTSAMKQFILLSMMKSQTYGKCL